MSGKTIESGMSSRTPSPNPDLVLLGGDSRAAAAITARLPHARCRMVVRRRGPGDRVVVEDYLAIPDALPLAGSTIVNCVGTDSGSPEQLDKLNRQVPLAWAQAAQARSARAFVHLSSFSVFARREMVGLDSPLAPVTPYGRSKLAAEQALAGISGGKLAVSLLRVPILISPPTTGGQRDKLAALLRLLRLARLRPAPVLPIKRAMLSYDGLATAVSMLLETPQAVACAADPMPFSYELVAAVAREQGMRLAPLPVPRSAAAAVARMAPGLHERLLTSMHLADEDNLLVRRKDFLRLREIVALHLA